MRGDLQHGVARGVDDEVAGGKLLLAVVAQDLGAGIGLVAQDAATAELADLI